MTCPIFACNAPRLRQAGFAVLPANGKKPRRAGYRQWRRAPSLAVIIEWAEKEPGADIVYVPGLSKARPGDRGLVVLDADDEEACAGVVEAFGDTPGKVKTRRGRHYLYRASGVDLGKLTGLKSAGISADLKHGNSIVVAPPSRHQDDHDFSYSWEGCDETVIRDLPPFNEAALRRLVDKAKLPTTPRNFRKDLREGSRRLGLNDQLVAKAWSFVDQREMVDEALSYNEKIGKLDPRGPLPAEEVKQVVQVVWRDRETGKIELWEGRDSTEKRSYIELRRLCERNPKHGPNAYALLQVLRTQHSARCQRGETFTITPTAMAKAGVMPGWTRERYEKARNLLLAEYLIERVNEFKRNSAEGRQAAEFRLAVHPGHGEGGRC
jgi:hypothetical protein